MALPPKFDSFLVVLEQHYIVTPKAVERLIEFLKDPKYDSLVIKGHASRICAVQVTESVSDEVVGAKFKSRNGVITHGPR
jgi:hypothetical protein